MASRRLSLVFLLAACLVCLESKALISAGLEGNLIGQGVIDINLKNRTFLMVGFEGFHLGAVAYFQRPYEGFIETIYGAGIEFGKSWTFGVDAGYLVREVQNIKGEGIAASILFGYAFTEHFYAKVPFIYRSIDSGNLFKRTEVDFVPYLGVRYDF